MPFGSYVFASSFVFVCSALMAFSSLFTCHLPHVTLFYPFVLQRMGVPAKKKHPPQPAHAGCKGRSDRGTTSVRWYKTSLLPAVGDASLTAGGPVTGTTRKYFCVRQGTAFSVFRFKSHVPHTSPERILQPVNSSLWQAHMRTHLSHNLWQYLFYHTVCAAICQEISRADTQFYALEFVSIF